MLARINDVTFDHVYNLIENPLPCCWNQKYSSPVAKSAGKRCQESPTNLSSRLPPSGPLTRDLIAAIIRLTGMRSLMPWTKPCGSRAELRTNADRECRWRQ